MKRRDSLNKYLQDAIRDNWDRPSLSDFDGVSYHYRDVARKIAKLHILYENAGIKKGDKISLIGKNSAQWAVAFLSIVTYGAVAVPILNDFHPDSIQYLINHSESKLAFCDESIWKHIHSGDVSALAGVFSINDFSILLSRSRELDAAMDTLNKKFGEKYPGQFVPEEVVYDDFPADDVAVINYTSGSTGNSKGVMLSYRALWSNLQYCIDGLTFLNPGDGVVCMLPLAHMFGLMVDLLHCFTKGCNIHFLTRLPTPHVLLKAFADVKPKLVVAVPLVIEKIIKNKVFPQLQTTQMRVALSLPGLKQVVYRKIRKKIIDAFGGRLLQIIIGGAGLSADVETFLRKIKFPFTVGYGMTECGPLIAYAPWEIQRSKACGRIVDRMQGRIDSKDPAHIPGVLWVKGDNVMNGYFKNPEATKAVFSDGWMSTGDICTMDSDGFLYIRGRDKTMILGPSGQNIYPEEIEQVLNNMPYVAESLVVQDGNKLVALIYPDYENETVKMMSDEQLSRQMDTNIAELNKQMPAYSTVADKRIMKTEFEKTPKRSIKRYLYQK